jgi:hypothetical protein
MDLFVQMQLTVRHESRRLRKLALSGVWRPNCAHTSRRLRDASLGSHTETCEAD